MEHIVAVTDLGYGFEEVSSHFLCKNKSHLPHYLHDFFA